MLSTGIIIMAILFCLLAALNPISRTMILRSGSKVAAFEVGSRISHLHPLSAKLFDIRALSPMRQNKGIWDHERTSRCKTRRQFSVRDKITL